MKTIKEVSEITGLSIRTLRYYDEINLLKPTQLTDAGYRLYDQDAINKLQEIMFFRELELPLLDIKNIISHPNYDRTEALLAQKSFLEKKCNHLNGVIELIQSVLEEVNTMNFEAFDEDEIKQITDHTIAQMDDKTLQTMIQQYGSIDALRSVMMTNLQDEKLNAQLIKIYGSKDKALDASLHSAKDNQDLKEPQNEVDLIYKEFAQAKNNHDSELARSCVERLITVYQKMFQLENARYLLLEVAHDYLNHSKLEAVTDSQYGEGVTNYIGNAIKTYYGE